MKPRAPISITPSILRTNSNQQQMSIYRKHCKLDRVVWEAMKTVFSEETLTNFLAFWVEQPDDHNVLDMARALETVDWSADVDVQTVVGGLWFELVEAAYANSNALIVNQDGACEVGITKGTVKLFCEDPAACVWGWFDLDKVCFIVPTDCPCDEWPWYGRTPDDVNKHLEELRRGERCSFKDTAADVWAT